MNSKALVSAIAAVCMGLSSVASAQQDKDVRSDEAGRLQRRGIDPTGLQPGYNRVPERDRRAPGWDRADRGDRDDRGQYRGQYREQYRDHGRDRDHDRPRERGPGWDRSHGVGPDRDLYRGGRLPTYYRSRQYVVDDWRGHRLRQPPRGYHWVQTGADYVLVAIATGVIVDILLNP